MSDVATIYSRFGILPGASAAEIESAYLRLATQMHPSRSPGDEAADQRFSQLSNAYFVLHNPDEKRRYDDYLFAGGSDSFQLSMQPPPAAQLFEEAARRRAAGLASQYLAEATLTDALLGEGFPEDLARRLAAERAALTISAFDLPQGSGAGTVFNAPSALAAQPYAPPSNYGAANVSATQGGGYAGFWERFAAAWIDNFIILLILIAVMVALAVGLSLYQKPEVLVIVYYVAIIVIGVLYCALQESSSKQATLGKRMMHLQVTGLDGGRIGLGRAVGRHFGKILSGMIMYIGFLIQPFTERKQALHDMVASTLVVRDSKHKGNSGAVVAILLLFGSMFFVAIIGILASIAIPQFQAYQDRAAIREAMTVGSDAVKQLQANQKPGEALPDQRSFAHSSNLASVEFDKSQGAVVIQFTTGALKDKPMLVYPSAATNAICYVQDYQSPGVNNCPPDTPSALADQSADDYNEGDDQSMNNDDSNDTGDRMEQGDAPTDDSKGNDDKSDASDKADQSKKDSAVDTTGEPAVKSAQ